MTEMEKILYCLFLAESGLAAVAPKPVIHTLSTHALEALIPFGHAHSAE